MTQQQRHQKSQLRQKKAKERQKKKYQNLVKQEQQQAQAYLKVLEKAVADLQLEKNLERVLIRKLKSQQKLMSKIFAMMFPTFFGCVDYQEIHRVLAWDKNVPGQILGALPKGKWLKLFRKISADMLSIVGHRVQQMSEATKSRWQWTWMADDSVFKKYSGVLGIVGTFYSGQIHALRQGIDGLLLAVVVGDGKLIVPVDFEIRRPNPQGVGRPCYDKLTWLETMLNRTQQAFEKRGIEFKEPITVTDSWFGESDLMEKYRWNNGGLLVFEGKSSYVFSLPDGQRVKGQDFLKKDSWAWRQSPQTPHLRYARLVAQSPTFGQVTVTVVDPVGADRYYLMCWKTNISSTRLIRAFKKRFWIEWCFRVLKSLLATESCQTSREDACYGHFALRLIALTVIGYSARSLLKMKVTMEEIIFYLKHYWRFLDSELLDIRALSCTFTEELP